MDYFLSTVLPLLLTGLLPVVVELLRRLTLAGARALDAVQAHQSASTAAKLASEVAERLLRQIDHAIDAAATKTTGALALARRPESPEGTDVSPEEWAEIRSELADYVIAGLGKSWTSRLVELFGGGEQAPASAAAANVVAKKMVEDAIDSRFAERTDLAIAAGVRQPFRPGG